MVVHVGAMAWSRHQQVTKAMNRIHSNSFEFISKVKNNVGRHANPLKMLNISIFIILGIFANCRPAPRPSPAANPQHFSGLIVIHYKLLLIEAVLWLLWFFIFCYFIYLHNFLFCFMSGCMWVCVWIFGDIKMENEKSFFDEKPTK